MRAFFFIHCEPTTFPTAWPDLVSTVATIEAFGGRCSIGLTPQWARVSRAHQRWYRQCDAAGHRIAVHHHGYSAKDKPATWDGYSDFGGAITDPGWLGSMGDLMTHVQRCSERNVIGGSMSDAEVDWLPGLSYRAVGGGLVSIPTLATPRGVTVLQATYAPLVGPSAVTAGEVLAAAAVAEPGEVLGLVMHASEYSEHSAALQHVLGALTTAGITTEPLADVLGAAP
jgi:hypothetical protein